MNHRWENNVCVKCGISREKRTRKTLMAIVNHPPWDVYEYKQYYQYFQGNKELNERPNCN